ncbi:angiopoietin-related protein 3 [Takifugu rubripes]|uniref:Angiopoietin-like 3 n=1 Tax=Takifugu rubripes TaxID=31033 RepID=H2VDU6_TAKRU|nr:angiopoietin-related protein 3 [Takifugu rubripes]
MKLLYLLLLASCTAATPLESSSREKYTTLPSDVFTTATMPPEAKSRFALLDDVRLLANGLLQLGQSLREFVHKTKGQINDIFQKLNIFDRSFYQLSVVTSEIKEEEAELKKTTNYLKANNEEIKNLSLEINSKINSILQERAQLQSKVGNLEEKMQGLSQSMVPLDHVNEITTLKEVIETQEKTIGILLNAVREQHDQLNNQKIKITNLEDKISYDNYQDTVDKAKYPDPDISDLFEYLAGNSSLDTNELATDCSELFDKGETNSGIYIIKPNQSEPFYVYCEMGSDGGSTVVQRRVDGSVEFNQSWNKYELGFGDLQNDFWLGLEKIYSLTQQGDYILRIDLEDWKEERHWAEYQFSLEGPSKDYIIQVTNFSGDLPDALANSTGMRFSTKDRNTDDNQNPNCNRSYTGGWWVNACGETHLNGRYQWLRAKGRAPRRRGIHWRPAAGPSFYLKMTKMTLLPVQHTNQH